MSFLYRIWIFVVFVTHIWASDDIAINLSIQKLKGSPEFQQYCRSNPSGRHIYYRFVEWWSLERAYHPEKDKDGRITQALLERAAGFGGWSKTVVAKPDEVTVYKNGAFLHYWGGKDEPGPQNVPSIVKVLLQEQWQAARQKKCLLVGEGWLHPLDKGKPTQREPFNVLSWLRTLAGSGWRVDAQTIDQGLNRHFDVKDSSQFETTVANNLLKQYSDKFKFFDSGSLRHFAHDVVVNHIEIHVDEYGDEISRTVRQIPSSSASGQSVSCERRTTILPPVPEDFFREDPLFYTHVWAMMGGMDCGIQFCKTMRNDFSKQGNPDQLIYQKWQEEDGDNPFFLMIMKEMQKPQAFASAFLRQRPLFDQTPPETNSTASQRVIPNGGDNTSLDNLMPKYADGMAKYARFLSHFNPEGDFDEMQNHMSAYFEDFRKAQKFFEGVVHEGGAGSFINQVNTKYPTFSDEKRSRNEDVYQDFVAFLKRGVDKRWWSALPEGLASRLVWMAVSKENKFEHQILREKRNSPKTKDISFLAKDDPVYRKAEEKVNGSRPLESSVPSDVARFVKDFLSQCHDTKYVVESPGSIMGFWFDQGRILDIRLMGSLEKQERAVATIMDTMRVIVENSYISQICHAIRLDDSEIDGFKEIEKLDILSDKTGVNLNDEISLLGNLRLIAESLSLNLIDPGFSDLEITPPPSSRKELSFTVTHGEQEERVARVLDNSDYKRIGWFLNEARLLGQSIPDLLNRVTPTFAECEYNEALMGNSDYNFSHSDLTVDAKNKCRAIDYLVVKNIVQKQDKLWHLVNQVLGNPEDS